MYWIEVIDILRKNKFDLNTFRNPVKLSLSLIKRIDGVNLIFQNGLESEYSSKIAELCIPKPKNDKERLKKLEIEKKLPIVLKAINDYKPEIDINRKLGNQDVSFDRLKSLFDELNFKFVTSVSTMEKEAIKIKPIHNNSY